MDNILEISGLEKKYPKSGFALAGVTFSVPCGSIVGFVGENGAGKTTTIKSILGIIAKDSGMVKVFGQELSDSNIHLREDIGVVFDAINFNDTLTTLQLMRVMNGVYRQWDSVRFLELMERFSLPRNKKIKTFSRGMSMKLAIAVAMSHNSKLLILDEPTSGLDPIMRDEILDIFLDFVGDENHSILLSSHITSDLEKIADYITFIHNGSTLLTAKKDDLIYNYGVARCGAEQFAMIGKEDIVAYRKRDYQIDVLVSDKKAVQRRYKDLVIDNATIDEIMILLVKGDR